jgi:hypothetical protein
VLVSVFLIPAAYPLKIISWKDQKAGKTFLHAVKTMEEKDLAKYKEQEISFFAACTGGMEQINY